MNARVKVPLRRYGGKVYLAKWIVSYFPEHTTYIEPFCGSASVFFAKEPSQAEILNDIDGRLIRAFEIMRERPFELAATLWATPYAQENWRERIDLGDLEKSALEIAATQQFYAGATHTSTFSVDAGHANKNKAHVWADWFRRILPAAARLKYAQILNQDALGIIERFAALEHSLFYVDPPYVGHEAEYGDSVCFEKLRDALSTVRGRVILSGTERETKYFQTWRRVEKPYVGRARTGRHKTKTKVYNECLYFNWNEE